MSDSIRRPKVVKLAKELIKLNPKLSKQEAEVQAKQIITEGVKR